MTGIGASPYGGEGYCLEAAPVALFARLLPECGLDVLFRDSIPIVGSIIHISRNSSYSHRTQRSSSAIVKAGEIWFPRRSAAVFGVEEQGEEGTRARWHAEYDSRSRFLQVVILVSSRPFGKNLEFAKSCPFPLVMMAGEDLMDVKFRLFDGSDIGPSKYDPSTTVASLKETIVARWPQEKQNGPKTINDIKLINGGKILENSKTLAESKVPVIDLPGGVITMHVVVRPPLPEKNSEKQHMVNPKQSRCACSIL